MVTRNFVGRFAVAVTLAAVNVAAAHAETGFIPITDLGAGLYLGQYQGGLYPGGSNDVPAAHAAAGLAAAGAIVPRDTLGNPSLTGKYAMISIGMSNTTQEFCSGNGVECKSFSFMGQAVVVTRRTAFGTSCSPSPTSPRSKSSSIKSPMYVRRSVEQLCRRECAFVPADLP